MSQKYVSFPNEENLRYFAVFAMTYNFLNPDLIITFWYMLYDTEEKSQIFYIHEFF